MGGVTFVQTTTLLVYFHCFSSHINHTRVFWEKNTTMDILGCWSMRLFVKVGVNLVLLILYAYFFGQHSVEKYLKKGVTITKVDERQSQIKTPGYILDFLCILLFSN